MAYGKPGRPAAPNPKVGGKNKIPRSLGMVLRAIRRRRRLDQDEMMALLDATESPYRLQKERKDSQNKNPSSVISKWENAQSNLDFAVQHRYGLISETFSGVLHIVSLAYANLRDYCDPNYSERPKHELLNENFDLVQGLVCLSNCISAKSKEIADGRAAESYLAPIDNRGIDEPHYVAINAMLDAFVEGFKERQLEHGIAAENPNKTV